MTTTVQSAKPRKLQRPKPAQKDSWQENSADKVTDRFLLAAGAVLALTSVDLIVEFWRNRANLAFADPVFGVPFPFILLGFGTIGLVVAGICLFAVPRVLALGLVVWFAANVCLYRTGLGLLGWTQPYPFVSYLANGWHISAPVAGLFQAGLTTFLFGGGVTCWFVRGRRGANPQYVKMFCPACGGHIRFAGRNLGQNTSCPHCQAAVILRLPEQTLKMSCFFCQGHVEFPAHALGRKMPCPHCKKDITLLEPKTQPV